MCSIIDNLPHLQHKAKFSSNPTDYNTVKLAAMSLLLAVKLPLLTSNPDRKNTC
uniref:Uncharacterized protein n=1 Tax=Rhizophora mucronata TaxID=61149 RepID=A0A2P2NP62_RHIMU